MQSLEARMPLLSPDGMGGGAADQVPDVDVDEDGVLFGDWPIGQGAGRSTTAEVVLRALRDYRFLDERHAEGGDFGEPITQVNVEDIAEAVTGLISDIDDAINGVRNTFSTHGSGAFAVAELGRIKTFEEVKEMVIGRFSPLLPDGFLESQGTVEAPSMPPSTPPSK